MLSSSISFHRDLSSDRFATSEDWNPLRTLRLPTLTSSTSSVIIGTVTAVVRRERQKESTDVDYLFFCYWFHAKTIYDCKENVRPKSHRRHFRPSVVRQKPIADVLLRTSIRWIDTDIGTYSFSKSELAELEQCHAGRLTMTRYDFTETIIFYPTVPRQVFIDTTTEF